MTAPLVTQQPETRFRPVGGRDASGSAGRRNAFSRVGAALFFLKRLLLPAAFFALTASLSACVSLPDPGPAPARLQLTPALPEQTMGKPLDKQLVVALPLAGNDIDTDGIALVFNGREVRYLAGVRWTSPAPHIVQRALIDALSATHSLRGVTDESAGIAANARLLCDLRRFSLHYADPKQPPTAVLAANFRLLDLSSGSIMGTRSVNVMVPAGGRDNAALVTACETALSRCLAEVAPWVARTMNSGQ